jgi:hypothetical protein
MVQRRAGAVLVRCRSDVLDVAARLFWGHVGRRPHDCPALCETRALLLQPAREAEIGEVKRPLVIDQNIARFHVAMDDPLFVCVRQRPGQLDDKSNRFSRLETVVGDPLGKRMPLDECGHDEIAVVIPPHFMDRHNVRMQQSSRRLCLALESSDRPFIAERFRLGDFERHVALELRVERPIDGPK